VEPEWVRIGLLMAVVAAMLVSCEAASTDAAVPAGFQFVRDSADLFPPGQRRQADEALRSMAERTGVFGVVVASDQVEDPDAVAGPILAEIEELGGDGLIGICTPDDCDLTAADAYSDSLADVVTTVAPAPEPAPGQGIDVNPRNDLRRWREFVGAVSVIER
jgi:hypothetical protein